MAVRDSSWIGAISGQLSGWDCYIGLKRGDKVKLVGRGSWDGGMSCIEGIEEGGSGF